MWRKEIKQIRWWNINGGSSKGGRTRWMGGVAADKLHKRLQNRGRLKKQTNSTFNVKGVNGGSRNEKQMTKQKAVLSADDESATVW